MLAARLVLVFWTLVLLAEAEDVETPLAQPRPEVNSVSPNLEDRRRRRLIDAKHDGELVDVRDVEAASIADTRLSRNDSNGTRSLPRESQATTRFTKFSENETRRKKTAIGMPVSLYNHFRPVESNVPLEDVSQFLYFGQKLSPHGISQNASIMRKNNFATERTRDSFGRSYGSTTVTLLDKLDKIEPKVSRSKSAPAAARTRHGSSSTTTTTEETSTKLPVTMRNLAAASSLIIVVTESLVARSLAPNYPYTKDPRTGNNPASPTVSYPIEKAILPAAKRISPRTAKTVAVNERRHHHQHTYAYEITNVTRLLGNYTIANPDLRLTGGNVTTRNGTDTGASTRKEEKRRKITPFVKKEKRHDETGETERVIIDDGVRLTRDETARTKQASLAGLLVPTPRLDPSRGSFANATDVAVTPVRVSADRDIAEASRIASQAPNLETVDYTRRDRNETDKSGIRVWSTLAAASLASAYTEKLLNVERMSLYEPPAAGTRYAANAPLLEPSPESIKNPSVPAGSLGTARSNDKQMTNVTLGDRAANLSSTVSPPSGEIRNDKNGPPMSRVSNLTNDRNVPVFPVTPRILDQPIAPDTANDTRADRPFGLAKELEPYEIQKMYRSRLETGATMTTTTRTMETMNSGEKDIGEIVATTGLDETTAGNHGDKGKDNVLPIMQLYDTSDMFNVSDSSSSNVSASTSPMEVRLTVESRTTVQDTRIDQLGIDSTRATTPKSREDNYDRDVLRPDYLGRRANASFFFFFEPTYPSNREIVNASEVITKRHEAIATQETVAVVSYILATLVVFPIAVGIALVLRRLIAKNRKVLEESDTSSEISCRKDALNLENGDFKSSIEKAITKLPRIQRLCHEAEKSSVASGLRDTRWEFPRDKLRLQTVLGQGNFGQVWKAEADDLTGHEGTTRLVAVKTIKEGASAREKDDLLRELEIMQQLGNHPNVVTLLGCCTEEEPHYLILEYVMYGKLLTYLRDHRTRQDFYNFSEDSAALASRDLTVFGYCVARGMEYLASKKIIHRDLAARNVLVDHNKLCKIADFGMSRLANEDGEVIEARQGRNALPIRWMAPESLVYSLFTTKTDVWSFGILMWEIVTLGSTPYPDMAAREVMRSVQNGYRLEKPSHCRSELFRVVSRCWHADPDRRPEFDTLRREMAQLLEDSSNGHYVDLESFASECCTD